MSESLIGCVTNGVFYFRDAPHFHYSLKKSLLLEDLKKYTYTFDETISDVFNPVIQGTEGVDVPLGYGSSYGNEYGGLSLIDSSGISFTLSEQDGTTSPVLTGTSALSFDANVQVFQPTQTVTDLTGANVTIDFTHKDNTPNAYGITFNPGEEYAVDLQVQPAVTDGVFLPDNAGENYSILVPKDTVALSLADIEGYQFGQNPIPVTFENDGSLAYLRDGDLAFLEFSIKVLDVVNTLDLVSPGLAQFGVAYYITNRLDVNYKKYFIRTSTATYNVVDSLPRTSDSRVRVTIVEVPGQPGEYSQGSTVYVVPANDFYNVNWWNDVTGLAQSMLTLFDGIPPSCSLRTNHITHAVSNIVDNVLTLVTPHYDDSENTFTVLSSDLFLDNFNVASGTTAQLLNRYGKEFQSGKLVFIHQMEKTYSLPQVPGRPDTPVVITDLMSTEIDDPEFTNVEFKLEGKEIIFGRADNKIINPTFIKEGNTTVVGGWDTNDVELVSDMTKSQAFLHGRSLKLPDNTSYARQFIPNVDSTGNYALSMFLQSVDADVQVTIYEFNNGGTFFTSTPAVGSAISTITYNTLTVDSVFSKHVARVLIDENFNRSTETFFTHNSGKEYGEFNPLTTDIIIEIAKIGGGSELYLDAVQFEQSYNPTQFSHDLDYGIVEFEKSAKDYAPRFIVSGEDNLDNQGFMVLDIDKVDLIDTGRPVDMLSKNARTELLGKYATKTWSKLLGTSKFRRVGVFGALRTPSKGEYFLLPKIKPAKYVNFLGAPYTTTQNELYLKDNSDAFHVVVEDEGFSNLPNKRVELAWGKNINDYLESDTYFTNDGGTALFNVPSIVSQEVSKSVTMGVDGQDADLTIGYSITSGPATVGNISNEIIVVGRTPSIGEHIYLFNGAGAQSPLMEITNTNGNSIDAVSLVPDGIVPYGIISTGGFSHVGFTLTTTGVPNGFVALPEKLPYQASLHNNGSLMLTYLSSLTYQDKPVSMYSQNVESSLVAAVTFSDTNSYFTIPTETFNPLVKSVKIADVNNPDVRLTQVFTPELKNNTFYVDFTSRTIKVSDPGLTSINVKFKEHKAFINPVNPTVMYIHRSVIGSIYKEMSDSITLTEVQNQHTKSYFPALASSVQPIKPTNQLIYLTPHVDIQLYLNAQHGSLSSDTKITYRHNRPLI